jgi:hypothetical protein
MELLFLEDYTDIFEYQLMESSNGAKGYFIRGVVSRAGAKNKNKRVYPRNVMDNAIETLQEAVSSGGFVGELDHPPTPKININKISHKITKLKMAPDGAVLAEMVVLDTNEGRTLKKLIDGGVRLGVSTRGLGGLKPYNGPLGEGLVEVKPGFTMKAIDVVFDPSAGNDGRPNFVTEGITENGIVLGHTSNFERVWNDVFGLGL